MYCFSAFYRNSEASFLHFLYPRGRCEFESGRVQRKKEAICYSDNFLFSADGETRTLASQCLAVYVNPQSGMRLTAPRGRCESESGRVQQKKEAICNSDNFLFSADGETRTHTGQRPLPPQSSVSTISPHPQVDNFSLGLQIYALILEIQTFFQLFCFRY